MGMVDLDGLGHQAIQKLTKPIRSVIPRTWLQGNYYLFIEGNLSKGVDSKCQTVYSLRCRNPLLLAETLQL